MVVKFRVKNFMYIHQDNNSKPEENIVGIEIDTKLHVGRWFKAIEQVNLYSADLFSFSIILNHHLISVLCICS